ncbi:mRNA interferase MazF [Epsilonproteobacteria bacterium SCGC AD-311-C15]|jgi:mRNA interferase MazF|nr:mRNA interferase MazF [Epsilonproteobacteria bacterium SCGC AD-311-C15]
MKQYDAWNEVKKDIGVAEDDIYFKERDIFWAKLGQNVGFEQNGKGNEFTRPVIVLKKYSKNMLLAIPLSTTPRDGSFFFQFEFQNNISTALLVQNKLISSKRLAKKIGKIDKVNFEKLKEKLIDLIK